MGNKRSIAIFGTILFSIAVITGCATVPSTDTEPSVIQPQPTTPQAPAVPESPPPAPEIPQPFIAPDLPEFPLAEDTPLIVPKEDLWARIRKGFVLQDLESPLIKTHEDWYSSRPDYVARMMNRSQLYLYHIVEEVERRGLPSEIALLPMIESAFNPKAYSTSHASGIWQFIPSTGKDFGLNQNWWYDGRRNVLSATKAALDYLERLYRMFDSWELALAAYNAGEGNVMRAITYNRTRGLPTDYLNLRLPPETRNYVPKLIAIKHIVANPQAFGLTLNDVPNKPFFTKVTINKHIDIALAALFADITLEEFKALNPAYNTPVITRNDSETLLLPTTKVEHFRANMKIYGDRQLHSWQAYQGKKGERVTKIASSFGITPARLRQLNHINEKKGKLKTAQLLLVPMKLSKPLPTAAQIAAAQIPTIESNVQNGAQNYVVQKNDTLFGVARKFNITVQSLRSHNHLENTDIKVGDIVQIPLAMDKPPLESIATANSQHEIVATKTSIKSVSDVPIKVASTPVEKVIRTSNKPAPTFRRAYYTVKRGDTLSSIAQTFQVAVKDLLRWNKLGAKSRLMPGAKIKVTGSVR